MRKLGVCLALITFAACKSADKTTDKPVAKAAGMPAQMPMEKPSDRPLVAGPLVHPGSAAEWEEVDYASRSIDGTDLKSLPLADVQHIRAIIFGKHGRVFEDSTLQGWLASRPWYKRDSAFKNSRLNQQERANLDVVREAEAEKHTQIESGDMRFYQNRVLTTAMLGKHSPQDWQVIEAEVLANHGYVFAQEGVGYFEEDNSPELQRYFNERYWYQRQPEYRASQLSTIERQNLDTIAVAMMRQEGRRLTPGTMNLFQSTALTDTILQNIPLADLRLLRNEVYARHGRVFQTPWLADYFRGQPWYKPRADFSDSELSAVERANITLITNRERQLHEDLGTRTLAVDEVIGLRPEDARLLRNEIYARHGRAFQDPRLRAYFASLGWYRPSSAFRDDQLNDVERRNVKLLADQEKGRFTEG